MRLYIITMELPAELKAHKLTGKYKGCMECHIEGDFLLIWFDEDSNFIDIIRIGSHSELF
ncbi:MAG: type II toxin-antitoxin system YafQ family toxin [Mediterranea sp.]|nr:type II toxin-antitoxin system YafQ family toxin [Mediterranea sp.]